MKLLRIGSNLTVITANGDVITTSNCSDELFNEVYELSQNHDLEAIKRLLVPELCKEEKAFLQKKELVITIDEMVKELPHLFTKTNTILYRVNVPISIPEDLALAYTTAYANYKTSGSTDSIDQYEEFKSIDNFWMWCALNPNPASRDDLFRFLKHHGMPITKQGMFLAYRRVVSRSGAADKKLIDFISNNYLKVKSMWKKAPSNYLVCEHNNEYNLCAVDIPTTNSVIGNLESLYNELSTLVENQFTDNHTQTMDYRIGVEARIERHQGNQSNQVSCSRGLHVASKAYDYSGFGDTPILVVVNPMDVLAVPTGEDGKLRTCAFTPVAVLKDGEENNILENEEFDSSDILLEHAETQVNNLNELIRAASIYELNVNHILGVADQQLFNNILSNIDGAERIINKRIESLYSLFDDEDMDELLDEGIDEWNEEDN